jgi:hypothetical protein
MVEVSMVGVAIGAPSRWRRRCSSTPVRQGEGPEGEVEEERPGVAV